jgi:kynurenine 3-monooxygenase
MTLYPWTHKDKIALVGDSSHVVPFFIWTRYSGFEDISILNEMMEKYGDDWEMIFLNIKIT